MSKTQKSNQQIAMMVGRNTIFGNLFLSILKLFAGVFGHSQALISDGIDSLSDVFSTVIAMVGVKLAARQADTSHPYGHERFECVTALILSFIIAFAGIMIGWNGINSILDGSYAFKEVPGFLAMGVAIVSMMELGLQLILQVGAAFLVLSFFDYLYQWWEFERQLKMTKQEIKEEYKQTEGDPQIKGKIREAQRRMSQTRMMQAVPGADVVIRNPTHFAVALRYKPGQDLAPIVVAKGQDEVALRIVAVAEEHHVAVVENKPLARALYAETEIGRAIPAEQYGPVAEVLVYIYKLNNKTPL